MLVKNPDFSQKDFSQKSKNYSKMEGNILYTTSIGKRTAKINTIKKYLFSKTMPSSVQLPLL